MWCRPVPPHNTVHSNDDSLLPVLDCVLDCRSRVLILHVVPKHGMQMLTEAVGQHVLMLMSVPRPVATDCSLAIARVYIVNGFCRTK